MKNIEHAYAVLQETVMRKGFFEKTLIICLTYTAISLGMVGGGFYLLWLFDHIVLQLGAIVILSVGFVQMALVGHDIAHRQVFHSQRAYGIFGTVYWNFILGASFRYWVSKHDRHHANPNQIGKDPDLGAPFTFSEAQAAGSTVIRRWFSKYQKLYFFFVLALSYVSIAGFSVRFLAKQKITPAIAVEWLLYTLHFVAYFALLGSFLPLGRMVVLTLAHYVAMGIYLGMIFAPNHKGLQIFDEDETPSYAHRQIITSRNIRPHFITDFFYGGLNYQIEHHLFPVMPRARLKRVRKLVKAFCSQEGIPYRETSFLGSLREIYGNFVSGPAETPPAATLE